MSGLLEDDDCGPERGQWNVQTAAAGKGPQLWTEVLQVGTRGAAQEHVHVIVEALGPCAVDHDVRHCQHLEEMQAHSAAGYTRTCEMVKKTTRKIHNYFD